MDRRRSTSRWLVTSRLDRGKPVKLLEGGVVATALTKENTSHISQPSEKASGCVGKEGVDHWDGGVGPVDKK